VEGDSAVVGELQQRYLSESTAELEVLYADLNGTIDTSNADSYVGHDGVFTLESIVSIRCRNKLPLSKTLSQTLR